MKAEPENRLLRIARRVAEGLEVDWDRELGGRGEGSGTLRGLSRLASIRSGFLRALENAEIPALESSASEPLPFQWGHLQVRDRLGRGSFADVFRAYDPLLDCEVALKLLRMPALESREWLAEARRLARVRHPNVVLIHGVDVHDGRPGIWTDLVCGTTLDERLRTRGPVGVDEACQVGIELSRALAAVHAAGIVHGDVKAANVLREAGGRVVLTDFGAATDPGTAPAAAEAATPLSMAPELFDGLPPSPASDVYSLGVLLFLLVTGRYPVDAETMEELRARHRVLARARDRLADELPAGLREVLNQSLSPDPDARIASAGEMERLLIAAMSTSHLQQGLDTTPGTKQAGLAFPRTDRLVGRDAEFESLRAEFHRSVLGSAYPLIVHGDSGVGKTFLARHFQRWAQEQGALALYGRFYEEDADLRSPYRVFSDLLAAAGTGKSGVAGQSDADEPPGVASPPDGRAESLGQAFVALAKRQPLVLIFDDLQWATESSREVIAYLMRFSEGESVMLVGLARSEALDRPDHATAHWLGRQAGYRRFTTLRLEPFDRTRFAAVLEALVPGPAGTSDVPAADIGRLQRLSGGNPYFLVELLQLLANRGALVWEKEPLPGWRWRSPASWSLPDSLVMATRNRLGQLSPTALEALQGAAVLGDEFELATVNRVLGKRTETVETLFEEARQGGLVTSRALSPGADYAFRHSLVRQVLLEDLPPRRRRRLHAAAASALRGGRPGRRAPAAALSWHYEAAGAPVQTLDWSLAAWREARSHGHWAEAMTLVERANLALETVEVGGEGPDRRLELLLAEAETAWRLGQLERSEECADRAVQLARGKQDPAFEARALLQHARTSIALGRYQLAERMATGAAERFGELGEHEGVIQARLQMVAAGIALGNYRSAGELVGRLIEECRTPDTLEAAEGLRGWALALQGQFSDAIPLLERSVAGAERLGDMRELAIRLRWLHWVHLSVGAYREAFDLARRAWERARYADDAYDEAKAIMGMGQARLGQGLCGEAIAYLRRTLEKLKQIGAPHREAETLWLLGRAQAECGRAEPARDLLLRALALVRDVGDRDDEFRFLADLARVELASGRYLEALEHASAAVAIATELESMDGLGLCRSVRSDVLLALGRTSEALDEARMAVALLERTGSAESWRCWWILGRARIAAGDDPAGLEHAVEVLYRAVDMLESIRGQIPLEDTLRRREVTLLRGGPARELCALLRKLDREEEAAGLARDWEIPG